MPNILAATSNSHKLTEFKDILAPLGFSVQSVHSEYDPPSIIEDGKSFTENAILKAKGVASAINKTVFADDSGLEVEALNGEPGIYSARYAGEHSTDKEWLQKLLSRLKGQPNRRARFVCVIAVASAQALIGTARGEVQGEITLSPRGNLGFGYDPVFIPKGYGITMAEMTSQEKNAISHRSNALHNANHQGLFSFF